MHSSSQVQVPENTSMQQKDISNWISARTKSVHDVDDLGRPAEATHEETTLLGTDEIRVISEAIHANGGKVISNINFTLAWMVGNVERYSDALLAGFDTFPEATIDIITGAYTPSGKKCRSPFQKDDSVPRCQCRRCLRISQRRTGI